MSDDREAQPEPTTREPLVDLEVKLPPAGESQTGSRFRRKRLSDFEGEDNAVPPEPQPKPQYRPTLASGETASDGQPCEAPSDSGPRRPRLVNITAPPAGQEPRPRVARPRLAVTLSSDDAPGLQNIVDAPGPARDTPAAKQAQVKQLTANGRTRQSFSLALTGGFVAAVAGAGIWAVVTAATNYQTGWMAIGVGFLVGGTVRVLGRGSDKSFGHLGAALSIFGCLLGNLLSVCLFLAAQKGLSPVTVLSYVCSNPVMIPAAIVATFRSLDLLFYGIAIYEGYRLSVRGRVESAVSRVACRN